MPMERASTGLRGLDLVIDDLRMGDNVVWQVNSVEDYLHFVKAFVKNGISKGKKIIYMRFASHIPLVTEGDVIKYNLNSQNGFEEFSTRIHDIITREGRDVLYIFDCLSDLLSAWATDLMIGNFFKITCPYLFELNTIAYFSILKESSSFQTIARIRETTQILFDVHHIRDYIYVHPLKVWNRYSSTMFLPHVEQDNDYIPITSSGKAAKLFADSTRREIGSPRRYLDYWELLFMNAEQLYNNSMGDKKAYNHDVEAMIKKLGSIMLGSDDKILEIATKHFSLKDLLEIKARMIGTGFIGGKTVGMLLARKILEGDSEFDWKNYLEYHDSFYIGSDVFYTFLIENSLWKARMEQRKKESFFSQAYILKEKILYGRFPEEIREQFKRMLEHFGQSPIIVRSSSLLEDGFGNAFAGKYESIFCVNQGSPDERYDQFEAAVRKVYASTMSEDALNYRLQRGLDNKDEQMALLVQRVSGDYRGRYFMPDVAGVGFSYNAYSWNKDIDPSSGMLRLVMGLGTRAVDRVENDYPRIVALDAPVGCPQGNMEDMVRFSQHDVDVLNIEKNINETVSLKEVIKEVRLPFINLIGKRDYDTERRIKELGMDYGESWILTFERLMTETSFPYIMQRMLKRLEGHYEYPVDVEFTVNFSDEDGFYINLLQCRPLQTRGVDRKISIPDDIVDSRTIFKSKGNFMGGSLVQNIKWIIYVDPEGYNKLPIPSKYEIARVVGSINRLAGNKNDNPAMLMGPGRWGSSTPSLGVPVTFSEINHIAVLVEMADMGTGFAPELSFGTHFFQDLVETNIFYVALFPEEKDTYINLEQITNQENILARILPGKSKWNDIVKVVDVSDRNMRVLADIISQRIVCYY